ncbi:hypothetical protein BDC45DRAFT_517199 [Circinella umbellata]|nr:hypothetical protein BDC45DRAFT_517199 [Circinella umbellata]
MDQFNILLQKHPYIYFSSATNSTITSKDNYYFFLTDQKEFMLNILFRPATYLTIYLALRFILIYMLQQPKGLTYYAYTVRFIFDRQKRICNNDNRSNSKSCRQPSLSPGDNSDNKTHFQQTAKNNGTATITSQNNDYFQCQNMLEKLSSTPSTNGLAITHNYPLSSDKDQRNSINDNSYQNSVDSLNIVSTTTPYSNKPLTTNASKINGCSKSINTLQTSVQWPPRKDMVINEVVERTLSSKLITLWKEHEISMENYSAFFPGQPSLRRSKHREYRRHYARKREKNDNDITSVLANKQPEPQVLHRQHQEPQEKLSSSLFYDCNANYSLLASSPSSDNTINSHNSSDDYHNRYKLYLLARDVLLYYEKEYGSQRGGTPEAKKILFLRQAISNFTSTNW